MSSRNVMDSDTREERLEWLEPVIEDWHTLMCLLQVNHHENIHINSTVCFIVRLICVIQFVKIVHFYVQA